MKRLVKDRPAEVGAGVAGAVAFLIGRLLGVDDTPTLLALTVTVGAVPAGITWLVNTVRG